MENFYYSSSGSSSWWPVQGSNSAGPSPFSAQTPLLPHHISDSCSVQFCDLPHSWPAEDKASSASKSHSQAEKRRRDRINAQLATLRKLIPKSDKMDKAALLGSVIEHVKDLKRKAMDIGTSFTVPTEIDEVSIDQDESSSSIINNNNTNVNYKVEGNNNIMIRASVCCEDRPELFSELIKVLKGLRLTAVKAEIASVGGRIKSVLVLCSKDSDDNVCVATLKQSLKSAVTKIAASSSSMASACPARSKRQRFFLPSPCLH
ncbi:transcription factor bHLH51 [Neltuma alba]|uniref:transcription factor bHLH51 n=1 Tax=Neltuma alba TaxID=207710 RepID=UPI0010A59989|nr:transcription factor bHLH51-like [Prosopis alba]